VALEQRIVRFSGNVQGVGFRYTACTIARRHKVTGHVRNMSDGDVECLVEGQAEEIDAFLRELGEAMADYVHRRNQRAAQFTGKFQSFGVRF